jgi:hypothetical protein
MSGKDSRCGATAAFEQLRTVVSEVDQQYSQATRKLLILIGKKMWSLNDNSA